jgi:predicted RNase H-related nuclease YkuK (DUF458 family)
MRSPTKVIIGILAAAIIIPSVIYTISPLFINTRVNEPLPLSVGYTALQKFMNISDEQKIMVANDMSQSEKDMIMAASARENNTVNENISSVSPGSNETLMGNFVGAGDGFHNAEGVAKVIQLADRSYFVRLENFVSTNGPDLYVYLSTDKTNADIVNLGKLKVYIGNQNYPIPVGTDQSKYNNALIWCRPFSVLFGSAHLSN